MESRLQGFARTADTGMIVHTQYTFTAEPRAPMKKCSVATCAFHGVANHGESAFDGEA